MESGESHCAVAKSSASSPQRSLSTPYLPGDRTKTLSDLSKRGLVMKSPFLASDSGSELYNPKVRKSPSSSSVWSARLSRNSSSGSIVEESVRRFEGAKSSQLSARSSLATLPKSVPDLLEPSTVPPTDDKVTGAEPAESMSSTDESTNRVSYSTVSTSLSTHEIDVQPQDSPYKSEEDTNEDEEKEGDSVLKGDSITTTPTTPTCIATGGEEVPDSAGENPASGHPDESEAEDQNTNNTQTETPLITSGDSEKGIYTKGDDAPVVNEISPNPATSQNQDSVKDKTDSLNETERLPSTSPTVPDNCDEDEGPNDAPSNSTGYENHSPRAPEPTMLVEPVSQIHEEEERSPLDRKYHTPSQSLSTNCSNSSMSTVYSAFSDTSRATKPESPGDSRVYSPVAGSSPPGNNTTNNSTITNEDTIQSPSETVEGELADRMASLDVLPLELTTNKAAIPRTPSQPDIASFRAEDIPPVPQYSPPRVPVEEVPQYSSPPRAVTDDVVMSRRSILEAFDNDIRDLLSTEGYTSMFTNMKFQNEDLLFQDFSRKSSVVPSNSSPQHNHSKTASTASSISFSNFIINPTPQQNRIPEEFDEDPSELDPRRHRANHSTSTNNSGNMRNSRSTLSSYGMSDVVELDPEDPRSRVFQSPQSASSPRHKSFGSSSSIGSNWGRPRSISARLEQPGPAPIPPMPPLVSSEGLDEPKYASTITSSVLPKQLNRMNSDVEPRVKRGRLSLRRKSAATLRLSSLSLHTQHPPAASTSGSTSPVKDNSAPPTPSMQLLTATYESFLTPQAAAATKAVFPTDQQQIPLWFLRQVLQSKSNPAGAFLTPSLYLANDLWHVDTISPKLLESRLKCINDLTKIGADHLHQTNTYYLKNALDVLESQFNAAFLSPLAQPSGAEMGQRRPSSAGASNPLTPTASQSTQTTTASSHKSVFKRLRKKSTIGADSPPSSEPQTPVSADFQRLTLANYLTAISSLANALQSVQQHFNETKCGGEWLTIYRTFIAHVACRLILKDLSAIQDIYKSEFREFLLSR